MNKRQLGATGLEIAPIVFGGNVLGWTTDEAESFRVLDAFVAHGFGVGDDRRAFDTDLRIAHVLAGGGVEHAAAYAAATLVRLCTKG